MVTINHLANALETDDEYLINNIPHQHAFVLVGKDHPFGVHMTQYHCELHKYQLVYRMSFDYSKAHRHPSLPQDATYESLRAKHKDVSFYLCNASDNDHVDPPIEPGIAREYSIPDLGSHDIHEFQGNIFWGLPNFSENQASSPHFFPWSRDICEPAIRGVKVTVERIVLFKPFDHVHTLPNRALYYLFGEGEEAHMTHLQTAMVSHTPFAPRVYGPDYDEVLSLADIPRQAQSNCHATPEAGHPVLSPAMLKAGVVVSVPDIEATLNEQCVPQYPCQIYWYDAGQALKPKVTVMYRGLGPDFSIRPGELYLHATAVCNSEGHDPCPTVPPVWGVMPDRFYTHNNKG